MFYRIWSCWWSWNEKNRMYPSSSSHMTHVTVDVNCRTCHKKNKIIPIMAPKKWLGVGAECTVSLRFLHPKDKIEEKIPNQTKSQKLLVLVVQERMEKPIRRKPTQCVVFRHEDFGGQSLWCMEKYVKVDVEGPKETFFDAVQFLGPNWQRMLSCAYTTQLLHSTGEVCWNNKDSYFIWFKFVC